MVLCAAFLLRFIAFTITSINITDFIICHFMAKRFYVWYFVLRLYFMYWSTQCAMFVTQTTLKVFQVEPLYCRFTARLRRCIMSSSIITCHSVCCLPLLLHKQALFISRISLFKVCQFVTKQNTICTAIWCTSASFGGATRVLLLTCTAIHKHMKVEPGSRQHNTTRSSHGIQAAPFKMQLNNNHVLKHKN
jgi:hypothetical protein